MYLARDRKRKRQIQPPIILFCNVFIRYNDMRKKYVKIAELTYSLQNI